ncbi:hypothetical protein NOM74_03955 [Klebsiella quasipneumoniae]|uniref:DUF6694 family lipoprotein n=1 Tax=Klebsiella quasipneumoniae TaxID=1463165 RepID=UPI00217E0BA6|nr:DUF6694 family lipoprotein [Klebsiella quasipneumoniae]MCS6743810.1 hypothetical protein [Klebsiella quasipneumoniae]
MKISYMMILVLSMALNGCDRVEKFDGKSPESLELSTQKVCEQLSDDRKKQLQNAIKDIMDYYATEAMFNNDDKYSAERSRQIVLDGKSADQVILEARSYRGKKAKLLLLHQQGK